MGKKPNIILLMADQLRGDCLGIDGHPDVKTPFLDALAAEGVRYTNAYSACPTCVPARATLYTGMSQKKTGRVGYEDRVDWNYEHTLAGELAKAGYYTQCVGKMHVHPLRNNLGFHNVRLHDGYLHAYRSPDIPSYEDQRVADDYYWWLKQELGIQADPVDLGLDCNSWVARPWMYEEKYHPTNWVASECLDFLRRRDRDQPFFLMASFVRPHPPLDAPQYYFDLYQNKKLAPPSFGDWNDTERQQRDGHSYHAQTSPSDEEYIHQLRAGYYASITHMDHQIGRLVSMLVEQKLMDNTVILFVSDHGEMLGDHLMFQKAKPFQGSIRVPLFLSGPKHLIGEHHRVCGDVVELRDVMPTLLELAGAPIPDCVDGKSLLHTVNREYLHGEHSLGEDSMHFIVTKQDKYIWYSQTGRELYFSLETDPQETHNALEEEKYADRIKRLRNLLIQELSGREEGYSDGTRLIVGRPPQTILRSTEGTFRVNHYLWETNGYCPETVFRPKVTKNGVKMSILVQEANPKREKTKHFEPVHLDSCVEWFVNFAPELTDCYFNFEVNANGAMNVAFRKNRTDYQKLTQQEVESLRIKADILERYWRVEYEVPFSLIQTYIPEFEPKETWNIRANFYKCGDETEFPHYGAWKKIELPEPDFHRPEFFGDLRLK